ncbi:MAG: hypothetical protein M3Y08_06120 [Fibrobacterota bacterium]|nr:hypothetical protein [Fibrobacterota bacterium]
MIKKDVKTRTRSTQGFTEAGGGLFGPITRMAIDNATLPLTIMLASPDSLVRSLLVEILETHGYKVLSEGPGGLSAVIMGHSYPGTIHVMIANMDYHGRGKGPALAENLAHLRPRMDVIFFSEVAETLWLIRDPGTDTEVRIPFSPGAMLEWVAGLRSPAVP